MLLKFVSTFHFVKETGIIVNGIFTAQWFIPPSALTSLTSIVTTKQGWYTNLPNNCQIMVLWLSTMVLDLYSIWNSIATPIASHLMIIPINQRLTTCMGGSIQCNPQYRHSFAVLQPGTTVQPASLLVTCLVITSTLKLIYGDCVIVRKRFD